MKKHYLVTGGGGFIGSNIVKMLIKKGNKVSVFDNFQRGKSSRLENISKKIKLYKGDIRDKKLLLKSFKKIDSVIHLAYVNGTKFFYDKPEFSTLIGMIKLVKDFKLLNQVPDISQNKIYKVMDRIDTWIEESYI